MGSEILNLPIIDFSNQELKPGTPFWNSLTIQVREALEEYGCFEASFDKIPRQLRKAVFDVLAELFDLPLLTKLKNNSSKFSRGYIGQHPTVPLYESMGIEDVTVGEKIESFTKMMWPKGKPDFSNTIKSILGQLSELDQIVRRMVLESLGVEHYMNEHMESCNYLVRFMKYKEPQTKEAELGMSSHTDKNIVTILYPNHVRGLEFQTKNGQWIDFKPSPDSFAVLVGDAFHAWTNGRLHSPFHRVMMSENEVRYSIGVFSTPKKGFLIEAPKELVNEEHPRLFKPYDHAEYMAFYYTEEGQKVKSALKAHCGL